MERIIKKFIPDGILKRPSNLRIKMRSIEEPTKNEADKIIPKEIEEDDDLPEKIVGTFFKIISDKSINIIEMKLNGLSDLLMAQSSLCKIINTEMVIYENTIYVLITYNAFLPV